MLLTTEEKMRVIFDLRRDVDPLTPPWQMEIDVIAKAQLWKDINLIEAQPIIERPDFAGGYYVSLEVVRAMKETNEP